MATNLEKLTEELNAFIDYNPLELECHDATLSESEKRIYVRSFDLDAVFQIDFDEILPFDPSGRPGTTNDVFAGARISILLLKENGSFPDKASADNFYPNYFRLVRLGLCVAAREGRISSRILAESCGDAELLEREASNSKARLEGEKQAEEFFKRFDPETRRRLTQFRDEQVAKRKAEGKGY